MEKQFFFAYLRSKAGNIVNGLTEALARVNLNTHGF